MTDQESSSKTYPPDVVQLLQDGARAYAEKKYDLAADKYSDACERVNLSTGEDDPDLLFLYGKVLFQNGVSNSTVLGDSGDVGNSETDVDELDESKDSKDGASKKDGLFQFSENAPLAEEEDDEEEKEEEEKWKKEL
ncbi:unnamed protein product [[Candida] boidinii]|nr:unnamed protein product [[Candida] boidinii]